MTPLIKLFVFVSLLFPLTLFAGEEITAVPKAAEVMGVSNILQIISGLFIVLMVILGAAWMLKRYGGFGGMANSDLKVIAGITVGQREKIVVVQVGEVQLLVGVSAGNIRTLHVLEQHISDGKALKMTVTDVEKKSRSGFIDHLNQQVKKREKS